MRLESNTSVWVGVKTPIGITYTTLRVLNTNTGLTNESFYIMGKNIWSPMDLVNIESNSIKVHGLTLNILDSLNPPQPMQKISEMQDQQKTFLSSMLFTIEEQQEVEEKIAEFCVTHDSDFDFWADYLSDTQIIRWAAATQDNMLSAQQYLKIFHNNPEKALEIMKNLRESFVEALHRA